MKSLCILALGMLAVSFLRAADISGIPPEYQIILSLPQGAWIPSEKQVEAALTAAQDFLKNPQGVSEYDKAEIGKIPKNSHGYRVQAWGVFQDGKKRIHLNFFPAFPVSRKDNHSDWNKRPVVVDDGGFYFWNAEIDVDSGDVVVFMSNGNG